MPRLVLRAVLLTLLALIAVPAAALAQTGPYAELPGPISAYPSPGTVSASPSTQISLRGAPASRLRGVRVTGAKSGRHSGRLRAHSDGKGASFVLARKLRQGERVTVRTDLPIRGTSNGDFTFRTARMPKRVTIQNLILENIPAKKTRKFHSRPDLAPPFVNVDTSLPGQAPGLLFLSPKSKRDEKQAGPLIADNSGQPIWFAPLPGDHGRHRLPHPDLQGQARAHLLARHVAPGHRHRRDGDARPVLPRHPPHPHGQRLPPRPARVPDHAGRQGAAHHLPDRAPEPEGGEGPEARPGRRLGDPGDRPRDRPRDVRVALARPHRDQGELRAAAPGHAVRLRAHATRSTPTAATS